MPNLLIVDDQKGVRDAIASVIPRSEFGIGSIMHAGDCGSAVDMIDAYQPDIVFLDIVMNGKDGFAVARHIIDRQIPCHIVIMTAFPEFDYAVKALRCKAAEFLLKPITQEKVCNVLHTICRANEDNKKEMRNSNRREMFYYLLLDHYLKNQEVHIQPEVIYEHTGLNMIDHSGIMIVLLEVTREEEIGRIASISEEFAGSGYEAVYYPQTGNRFVFLLGCRTMPRGGDTECLLGILRCRLHDFYAGLSSAGGEHSLKVKYQQSAVALEYAQGNGLKNDIIALGTEESVRWVFSKHEEKLALGFGSTDGSALKSAVADVFVDCMKRNLPPAGVAEQFEAFFLQYGVGLPAQIPRNDYFSVKSKVAEMLDGLEYPAGYSGIPPGRIREVIDYVQKHFADDIGLSDVAGALDMNYYYLSYLFKKSMHVGFADYLNNIRLENAARLLSTTHYTIDSIARIVGYTNARHFFKRFKDQYGYTPKQYRDKHVANEHVV